MLNGMVEVLNQNSSFSFFERLYFMLVASFGIPANLLSTVVLCGQRCGMSRSTVIYLVSLAVVDTLFLLLGGLVTVAFGWTLSVDARPLPSAFLCGVVGFNEGWTLCSSQWIVVAFTLERYLVCRGRRPRRLRPCRLCLPWPRPRCWPSRAQVALLLVLLSVLASQVLSLPLCWVDWDWLGGGAFDTGPTFILMQRNISQVTLSSQCQVLPGSRQPVFLWLHALLSGCLPMSLTLFFSVLMSRQFRRRARVFAAPGNAAPFRSTGSRMRRSGRIQATVALVAVLLALPRYITQGLEAALGQRAKQWSGWTVAVGVATMMQWLSLVIHFLLYCFLSSGFRRETLTLLRCLCKSFRKPAVPCRRCCSAQSPQTTPCQVWLVQDVFQEPVTVQDIFQEPRTL